MLGKAGASRQLGIRPASGLWMRKTGVHGRKTKRIGAPLEFKNPFPEKSPEHKYTVDPRLFLTRNVGVRFWI